MKKFFYILAVVLFFPFLGHGNDSCEPVDHVVAYGNGTKREVIYFNRQCNISYHKKMFFDARGEKYKKMELYFRRDGTRQWSSVKNQGRLVSSTRYDRQGNVRSHRTYYYNREGNYIGGSPEELEQYYMNGRDSF
ncbi:hypothetical protein RCC89_01575 [Cytophagaceae bacterium ABcell3]|nr:hypothetical protein RCC89_01575 [Cytophagaceae bacterium ABcell3]